MSTDTAPDNAFICANCHALNPPNALICVGCGVNLAGFRAAVPRIREMQSDRATAHLEQLTQEAHATVTDEAARRRRVSTASRSAKPSIPSPFGAKGWKVWPIHRHERSRYATGTLPISHGPIV